MTDSLFRGVMPAITTPFASDGSVDLGRLEAHCRRMVEEGCSGVVPLGSLGEGATLDASERAAVLEASVRACGAVPVIAGVAATSTKAACEMARLAAACGCRGLMVLPAMLYPGSPREEIAHARAVIGATDLPCMLYNNPAAYGTDFTPGMISELAGSSPNLVAVKESSGDCRRVTAILAEHSGRLDVCVGLDDMVVEGFDAGARGWVAGLVNALPVESIRLWRLLEQGEREEALALYRWFLPLLRLDTGSDFVQWIKLAQEVCGTGTSLVRPPRLPFEGAARERALEKIRGVLATRRPS
ncbi:MAG: dihydrodipicolinate synthase family protein [Planctomycetota bacterium]